MVEPTPVHPRITIEEDGMWVARVDFGEVQHASSVGTIVIREMVAAARATGDRRRFTSYQSGPRELTLELLSEERSKMFNSTLPYRPRA